MNKLDPQMRQDKENGIVIVQECKCMNENEKPGLSKATRPIRADTEKKCEAMINEKEE